ncbi:methylmalonyl-CoA mutase small subunit [Aldersonia sp. NBC_00410]|uniref:methylmalonyl-CoA mutase small subunit n=1 Tax=Aldersonia sp. NBC_00410 TaxID=2975954 RepID=UPI00224DC1FB|nr:methylmalonyl-CoA mutase small subunit [Aldersonia sp. NBC_00410]MCX5046632.1 methylmalonyl-CoA mutase small subunit [Aldersonia sp. NBC_00410]
MPIASGPDAGRDEAYADWRKGVGAVLAKAHRTDPADLPAEPERLLDVITYDGVTVAPLYTEHDELTEPALPGAFPYVRGRDAHRDVNRGWFVGARYGAAGADAAAVNRLVLDGLDNGVGALWLATGSAGVPVADLGAALEGVLLDLAPLTLDAGADVAAAAAAIFALLDERIAAVDGVADRADVQIDLGAAPLTDRFAGVDTIDTASLVELAVAAHDRPETIRAITVDGAVFHNAGASDAEELGAAVAVGLDYLRALTGADAGLSVEAALGQLAFRFAATDDQFTAIAKFRAARQVWARVAEVVGAPGHGGAPQHAVTSAAMMSQRDPWVNMLRTTLAAFGAGVGGADTVTVLPFDAALPAGALDVSASFAQRVARNIQLLLLEESHLGRVLDPAGGSWFVESMTTDLAAQAWEFVQQIEAAGGYRKALESGVVADRIAATAARRRTDIAHRKTSLTGVNEFPNLTEPVVPATAGRLPGVARYAQDFETLRDRSDAFFAANGSRPTVFLAPLGTVAEHNVRTTFAANLLASGGIEAVNPGPIAFDALGAEATASGASIAVLCGTDKAYGADGAAAVDALRAAGIREVLLAGPEKAFADAEHKPDGYLTMKIDAVAALTELLEKLGA